MNKFYFYRYLGAALLVCLIGTGLQSQQISGANELFQNQTLQEIEVAKLAWSTLLTQHPYYNRPQMSKAEWKRTVAKQDRPDLAMEQDWMMTMDPALGHVPYDRKIRANNKVVTLQRKKTCRMGGESKVV